MCNIDATKWQGKQEMREKKSWKEPDGFSLIKDNSLSVEKKKKDSEAFDFDHCYSQLRRLLFVLISPRSIEYLLHVW